MGRKTKINITALFRAGFLAALSIGLLCSALSMPAAASYLPFNTNVNMNVGIGTSIPQGAFVVMNGNVGIGTWVPGAQLDVEGTLSIANFAGNVGIGTSRTTNATLSVGGSNSIYTNGSWSMNTNYGAKLNISTAAPGVIIHDTGNFDVAQLFQDVASSTNPVLVLQGGATPSTGANLEQWQNSSGLVLDVVASGGNVGIGTSSPFGGGLIVLPANTGNVGIGSLVPGQALDVQGTVRMTGLTLTGNGAANGNVLVGNGVGVGTWMPASTLASSAGTNYWLLNGGAGNIGINTSYAVGIGTTFVGGTGEAALSIMNGNVGIGTWVPQYALDLHNGTGNWAQFTDTKTNQEGLALGSVDSGNGAAIFFQRLDGSTTMTISNANGSVGYAVIDSSIGPLALNSVNAQAVGIATFSPGSQLSVLGAESIGSFATKTAPIGGLIVSGNVGIGSAVPGQVLDVNGTARLGGFTLTGNGAANGNVLVGNSVGVGTWMPASALATTAGTNYWLLNGGAGNVGINTSYAVGIGTSFVGGTGEAALSVMNGNVGIGTWVPKVQLDVEGTLSSATFGGNVGIGTWITAGSGELSIVSNGAENPLYIAPQNNGGYSFIVNEYGQLMMGGANNAGTLNVDGETFLVNTLGNGGAVVLTVQGASGQTADLIQAENNGGSVLFDVMASGNVGIGTTKTTGGLSVMNGNVGVGTWVPGSMLDVNGTARMTGFTLTGNGAGAGNVLVGNAVGLGTWMPASTLASSVGTNYWLLNGGAGNIGINTSYAVGIGTSFVGGPGEAALSVMNGNVGIGTWIPASILDIVSNQNGSTELHVLNPDIIDSGSREKIIIGSDLLNSNGVLAYRNSAFTATGPYLPRQLMVESEDIGGLLLSAAAVTTNIEFSISNSERMRLTSGGNLGIGSQVPGQMLDVNGTVRALGELVNGNVGIGTSFVGGIGEAALSIMNGNVGIGTWVPNGNGNGGLLDIGNATKGDVEIDNVGDMTLSGQISVNGQGVFADGTIATQGFFTSTAPAIQGATGGGDADFLLGNGGSAGLPANSSGAGLQIEGAFTTAASGTHPLIAGAAIFPMTITSGGASVTNTAALYIDSAGTATVTGNKFALWVNSGNTDFGGNVGISSTAPGQLLDVQGTVRILGGGNLGIGSIVPGTRLDVNGTVRMGGFTLTGNGAGAGNVLVGNGVGVGTWMPASTLATSGSSSNYWINDTGNVGINTAYNIGVGTISAVNTVNILGNIGIGTLSNDAYMKTAAPNGGMIISGNVGIGTWAPRNSLEIAGGNIGIGTVFSLNAIGTTSTILTMRGDTSSVYVGFQSGASASGGGANAALGYQALFNGGLNSTAVGYQALLASSSAADTAVGEQALVNENGIHETALGRAAGGGIVGGGNNVNSHDSLYLGSDTLALADGDTDEIVIGAAAVGIGSYSVELGESNIARTQLQGNVGIGTSTPQGGLVVTNGNVGIGTWAPGTMLDVKGSARITGFTLTGNGAGAGNVLVGNGVGVGTWMPASTLASSAGTNYWLLNGGAGNIGINTSYAVGIGTSFVGGTGEATFAVMNGNVGIGTWVPGNLLDLKSGNIGIGTAFGINAGGVSILTLRTDTTSIYAGYQAGVASTAPSGGAFNTAFGSFALTSNLTGNSNTIMGYYADGNINGGNQNTAVGYEALFGNISASYNTAVGYNALALNQIGNYNTAIGDSAGYLISSAFPNQSSNNSVYIGNGVEAFANGDTNEIVIGANAVGIGSYTVELGNSSIVTTQLQGNVGIGTSVPGTVLDVKGSARMTGFTLTGNNAAAGNVLVSNAVGVGTWMPAGSLSSSNYWLNDITGNVGISTSYAVGIGTTFVGGTGEAALSVMNGNVGIGTWVPAKPFSVIGDSYLKGNIGIGTTFVGGTGEGALTVMNGNVGIGTWLPGTALNVFGNGPTHFGAPSGIVAQNGISLFADGVVNNPLISNSTMEVIATGGSSATIFRWGPMYVNAGSVSGYLGYNGGGVYPEVNVSATNADLYIGTATQYTDIVVKDISGNVGIGSIYPGTALDINGTARMTGFALSGNGAAAGNVMVSNTIGVGTWMPTTTLPVGTLIAGTVNQVAYYSAPTTIASNSAMVFNAPNVGLGTVAPLATLQVVGNIGIGTVANGDKYIMSSPTNGGMIIEGNVGIGTWAPTKPLSVTGDAYYNGNIGIGTFFTTGGAALTVMNGNVGIGTWGPKGSLDIKTGNNFLMESGNIGIGTITPQTSLVSMGNVGIGTWSAGGGNLIVNGGSNVGSGSAWPGQMLDIQGTTRDLGELVNGNVGIGTSFINGTGESALSVMNGNVGIGTWAGGGALVVMNGNVGIGTTNPTYQLAVPKTANINTLTTNKSTFMAVSYGTGAGASNNITIPATTFTKINFHSLTGYTLIDNGGNYSTANDWYTTPVAGVYMIITKFRVTDGQTQFISYGQGAGTAAADTPTFLWCQTATTTATRNGSHNVQFQHYAAGSNIEMFVYSNIALDSSDGDFQVYLVSAD